MIQFLLLFTKHSMWYTKLVLIFVIWPYIGETSNEIQQWINQYRPNSYKFSPSANLHKSIIELQNFNLHDFKDSVTNS